MSILNPSMFTLIIPSYERPEYIKRLTKYWSEFNINVHILDGSKDSISKSLNLPKSKLIKYHHLPTSIEKRLLFAEQLITTPYSALLSDDEFFLPSAIESCINFLEKNPKYSTCTGRSISFNWKNNKVVAGISYPGHKGIDAPDEGMDISDNGSFIRMKKLMSNYQLICLWAISRSNVLKASLRAMGSINASCAGVAEIQNALISTSYGGCKVLDEVVWLRSYENENQWWSFGRQTFPNWYKDPKKLFERERFFNVTIENLPPSSYKNEEKKELLEKLIQSYLDSSELSKKDNKSSILKNLINENFLKVPASIYRRFFKKYDSLIDIANQLRSKNIKINDNDLLEIEKLVTKFHNQNISISS